MNRTRTLLAACVLALPIPVAIAGCGDEGEDPNEVLTATFNNDTQVTSGVLDLTIDVTAEGAQGGSFNASLSGPFQGDPEDPNAIPQLDLTAALSGEGAGQSIEFEGGLVVTEDNAFVEYGGEAYEVGTENFAQLKEQAEAQAGATEEGDSASSFREGCEQAIEAQGGDPATCDIDLSTWFTDLSNEGTEDVGGAETTHIAGTLDVPTMLNDLVEIGTSVPSASASGLSPELIQAQIDSFAEAISTAEFNVYSATEDDTLRQLDFELGIDPSAIPGAEASGVDSVDVSFSIALSDVGSEQTVEAPADAKPIEQLEGALSDSLGGLVPGVGGTVPGLTPGGTGIPDGSSGLPGPGDPVYEACMNQANTPQEFTKCLQQAL